MMMVRWMDVRSNRMLREIFTEREKFDLGWHDSYYYALRDLIVFDKIDIDRLKSVIDGRQQGYKGATNIVNYIGNHDHDRMLIELGISS